MPSAHPPLADKTITENIELTPTKKSKKDKKKKKKQESSQDNQLPLLEPEQITENPATIQSSEATELNRAVPPDESKDDDTASSASAKKTKKDKKQERLGSVQDEEAFPEPTAEPTAEPAQISSDSPDQIDAILSTEPDRSQADAPPKSHDALRTKEAANVDDGSSSLLNRESETDKREERLVTLSGKEAVSEPQLEFVQARPDNSDQNETGLAVVLENTPAKEMPPVEDILDSPAATPTKKSKKDKKKKKKAASREEEAPLEDINNVADPVSGETEQSEAITIPSAEVGEVKDAGTHSVSKDAVTTQDEDTPEAEKTALDELVLKEERKLSGEDAAQSEAVPKDNGPPGDDSIPQEGHSKEKASLESELASDRPPLDDLAPTKIEENKKEESSNSWEDELLQEFNEESAEAPAIDLTEPTEREMSAQEATSGESVTDTASVKKGKKAKREKNQPSPLAEELPEEKPAEDPIPIAAVDLHQTTEHQIQASTPGFANDDDLAAPAQTKKGKKDKKKRKSISPGDEIVEEQATQNSTAAVAGDITSPVVNEPPTSEVAVLGPPVPEPTVSEPPTAEPSNDDSLTQPISRKKSKKDKKKKKQMDSLEDVPQEALPEGGGPKADSPPEQVVQEGPPQEDMPKELSTESPPQEELPKELPKEELPKEALSKQDIPREELVPQEVSDVAPGTLNSADAGQVTLLEVEAKATPESTTIFDSVKTPSDETTEPDVPLNDDFPSSPPTKRSKKDKKKKKQASISEVDTVPQEEPKQLEEDQSLPVAQTTPEVGLPLEGEASEAVAPDDVKPEDLADQVSTRKSKKDKKKKKQALPEADIAQEPVESPVDPVPPSAPNPVEQAKAEISLLDVARETEATEPAPTQGEKGTEKENPTPWEDEVPSQLQPSQEPDLSRDASAEPSQSEGVLELVSSKKGKKSKKKKRASEVESQPEVQPEANPAPAGELIAVVEPTEINSSSLPGEQPPSHVFEDQGSGCQEPSAPGQDDATKLPDNLDTSAQSAEPTSTEETAPSTKFDDTVESNIEPKITETTANIVLEGATPELSSKDQQATPRAADEKLLDEPTLETGPEIGTDSLTPLQEPETAQPETAQSEETPPKVDDGKITEMSKKSKKDKKKKKRASQVSWESGPEAEIEDLPEKQQSEQAFDKPMTSEPMEIGTSDETVEDPFPKFASGKMSEDIETRQSQIEGEPEPDSAETVEEPKTITPTEQGQRYDILLDHQSLAEDTQTSLKESTDLDDTFLETTSSKKSKKKKKASQLDWDAERATIVASGSATGPLPDKQILTDESAEPVDALSIETTEMTPGKEADADEISPEIVSTKQSKKDKRKTKKQSATETAELETGTEQPAENDLTTGDAIVSQIEPAATENLMPVDDTSSLLEKPGIPHKNDVAKAPSRNLSAEEIKPSLDQAQDTKELSQGQYAVHGINVSDPAVDTGPSHTNFCDGEDSAVLLSKLEEASDEVSSKEQAEVQKDTIIDMSQVLSPELPEFSPKIPTKGNKEAEQAQALSVSDADFNINSGTNLQSWDWSNIDNVTKPEISVPKAVPVPEPSFQVEPPTTIEASDATQTTSQQQQKHEPSNDNVDNNEPALGEPEPQPELEPDPESPITRKKSKKDKKKKKRASQSESETVLRPQTPQTQYFGGVDDPQNATSYESTIPEAEVIEPRNDEGFAFAQQSKGDKKHATAVSSEETTQRLLDMPDLSQELAAFGRLTSDKILQVENQNAKAPSPPAAGRPIQPQEQTSDAHDINLKRWPTSQTSRRRASYLFPSPAPRPLLIARHLLLSTCPRRN